MLLGLPGTVIYSGDMQNLTNCACSGQKGEKGQDGSVVFVNDTMNVAKGEKGKKNIFSSYLRSTKTISFQVNEVCVGRKENRVRWLVLL